MTGILCQKPWISSIGDLEIKKLKNVLRSGISTKHFFFFSTDFPKSIISAFFVVYEFLNLEKKSPNVEKSVSSSVLEWSHF